MDELTKIYPADLVDLSSFTASHPVKIDVVYAQPNHPDNIFKVGIYRPEAKMWCYRELAPIILRAADICFEKSGYIFELKDCLRTIEAQALMAQADIVKANPHWLQEPNRLLSPPGKGGHPRGMAVDIILLTENGDQVDMGTSFDHLTTDPANNPAARSYTKLSPTVLAHRILLQDSMIEAANDAGREILPLPQEWWDFRFMPAYANMFEPVSDKTLPLDMRVTEV